MLPHNSKTHPDKLLTSDQLSTSMEKQSLNSELLKIPFNKSGLIEDRMFQEDQQIYKLLNQEHHLSVEGMKYHDISQDQHRSALLTNIQKNIPKYIHLSNRQKNIFIANLNQSYSQKMQQAHSFPTFNHSFIQQRLTFSNQNQQYLNSKSDQKTNSLFKSKTIKKHKEERNILHPKSSTQLVEQELQTMKIVEDALIFQTPEKKKKKNLQFLKVSFYKQFDKNKSSNKLQRSCEKESLI